MVAAVQSSACFLFSVGCCKRSCFFAVLCAACFLGGMLIFSVCSFFRDFSANDVIVLFYISNVDLCVIVFKSQRKYTNHFFLILIHCLSTFFCLIVQGIVMRKEMYSPKGAMDGAGGKTQIHNTSHRATKLHVTQKLHMFEFVV